MGATEQQCSVTGKKYPKHLLYKGHSLRKSLFDLIKADVPEFTEDHLISTEAISQYRKKYLEQLVKAEVGEISELEKEVLNNIEKNELISSGFDAEGDFTFSQRLADRIAAFGGSWAFIIIFFALLFSWMIVNVVVLTQKPFDPYPFILLNLILSCIAAIQAPIILMSQNRKEHKDRSRSIHDYKINLKAELEIRLLHEKLDHMLAHQSQRLLEIQEIQTDYMEDILKLLNSKK